LYKPTGESRCGRWISLKPSYEIHSPVSESPNRSGISLPALGHGGFRKPTASSTWSGKAGSSSFKRGITTNDFKAAAIWTADKGAPFDRDIGPARARAI
jgi:hypothetical protein